MPSEHHKKKKSSGCGFRITRKMYRWFKYINAGLAVFFNLFGMALFFMDFMRADDSGMKRGRATMAVLIGILCMLSAIFANQQLGHAL